MRHVPPPADLVRRDRLIALLAGRPGRPFTVVSAPAGYGKSTLVARWLGTVDVAASWFSVEKSDHDVRHFLTYLIAAVRNHSKNACATHFLGTHSRPAQPTLNENENDVRL